MDIRIKKKSARRAIHLFEGKVTAKSPIEVLPLPQKVILPLQQHLGVPCEAVVTKGTKVLTGQKIGDSEKFVSAPIYSSVSGEISGTPMVISPPTGRLIQALTVTSDGEDKWVELEVASDPEALSAKEILERIRKAGLVGMGGATFPTHVKLAPPKDKKIDTVILNGCECEPYITSDHRVMLEYGEKVLSGLKIITKLLSPENVYIAIEDNKEDAIDHLEKLIVAMGLKDFKIIPLEAKYPTGAEKNLIATILGRKVPFEVGKPPGLPLDVGVVVHNVSTAKAIHEAVFEGKPFIERVITVTGLVKNPKNLLVRLGTPLRNLMEYCGGMDGRANEIILGGPMMGISHFDLDFPVGKGTSCVLVRETRPIKEGNCINCGRCLENCPSYLMPTLLAKYSKAGRYDDCKQTYVENCYECGTCTYSCPANIPIVQYIKVAKGELMKKR
jgi:electron transport complex protein RnfC